MPESHACATHKHYVRRPGPAWPLRYVRSYPGRPDQVRQVRAFLWEILARWPRADDAVTIASELATNSVLHSRSGLPRGMFTVRAEVHRNVGTCIAVQDEGGGWDFRPGEVRPQHGLDVVQALAGPGNWGVGGDAASRIVWARLLWPGAARPPAPPIERRATGPEARAGIARPGTPAADDVLADLDRLAIELAAHGVEAHLVIPGGNRSPHLAVRTAVPGLAERVYAQADWFFWPTGERLAARDDVPAAAVTIAGLLDGPPRT